MLHSSCTRAACCYEADYAVRPPHCVMRIASLLPSATEIVSALGLEALASIFHPDLVPEASDTAVRRIR